MSSTLFAPTCERCGRDLSIQTMFILLREDGSTLLMYVYDCNACNSFNIPTRFIKLALPISYAEMGELLKAGLVVVQEEDME